MTQVQVPTVLRHLTLGARSVSVQPGLVVDVVNEVDRAHPGFRTRVIDDEGALRKYVNVYLNDEDARFLSGTDTLVGPGDSLAVVPAISGG